jgi:hypothetical protein
VRKYLLISIACAAVAFACREGGGESRAVETSAPETATPGGSIFPEAARAEALLKAAGIAVETRNDLIRPFPEGCVWHAVYASVEPEIILETYAFEDWETAARYGARRNDELTAMDVLREFATVTNGSLLLVAYYDPTKDGEAKKEALTKFVSAFAGEE